GVLARGEEFRIASAPGRAVDHSSSVRSEARAEYRSLAERQLVVSHLRGRRGTMSQQKAQGRRQQQQDDCDRKLKAASPLYRRRPRYNSSRRSGKLRQRLKI